MNKYKIFKDGSNGLPEEVGEVEAFDISGATKIFFKKTAQIIPGAWAVPAEMTIEALLREPPLGLEMLI